MAIADRYDTAVRSTEMRSRAETTRSNTDLLGAAGLARKTDAFGLALLRLLGGDRRAVEPLVEAMATKVKSKAQHEPHEPIARAEATAIAQAVLAWHLRGTCRSCRGHGFEVIRGTPTIGETPCPTCRGRGKIPFDPHFTDEQLPLAQWLVDELQREEHIAGIAVMKALAPRLEL